MMNNNSRISKDLEIAIKKITDSDVYALDLETTSLDPYKGRIKGIALACGDCAWYFPFMGLLSIPMHSTLRKLLPIFEDPDKICAMANAKFDLSYLREAGYHINNRKADTMIMSWLVDERTRNGLKECARREFDHNMIQHGDLLPLFQYLMIEYATDDARQTLRLYNHYLPILEEQNLTRAFWEVEMPTMEVIMEMEDTGFELDVDLLQQMTIKAKEKIVEIQKECYEIAGEEFNLGSTQQLSKILFDVLHIPTDTIPQTKTGYSTAADILEPLREKYKIIDLLLKYRKLSKIEGTYTVPLTKRANENNGIVRCEFRQTITETGRLASKNPNFQNIARNTEDFPLRDAFVAGEGYKFIVSDLNQIELRLIAECSQDPTMLEIYRDGGDIHQMTADECECEERRDAKELNFGLAFGMGAYTLSKRINSTLEKAYKFHRKFFETYYAIAEYHSYLQDFIMERGYVETCIAKRRRRFHTYELNPQDRKVWGETCRKAYNTPIQGGAADLIKIIMRNIHRDLTERRKQDKIWNKVRIVSQIHDEIVLCSPEQLAEEYGQVVKEKMETAIKISIPIEASLGIEDNWGAAK